MQPPFLGHLRIACGLVVRALASCLVGRCSCGSNLGRVVPRPQKLELASVWPSPRHNDCRREILQMRMQSSSVSGRVAYCLPIGISSSKTKCVRLRNGRSLQHPKQISARAIVDATGRTILVLCLVPCLYSQLRCIRCSRVFVVLIAAKATAWAMYARRGGSRWGGDLGDRPYKSNFFHHDFVEFAI